MVEAMNVDEGSRDPNESDDDNGWGDDDNDNDDDDDNDVFSDGGDVHHHLGVPQAWTFP